MIRNAILEPPAFDVIPAGLWILMLAWSPARMAYDGENAGRHPMRAAFGRGTNLQLRKPLAVHAMRMRTNPIIARRKGR